MEPVRTEGTPDTYRGSPRLGVEDLPCRIERVHGRQAVVWSVWEPSPEERERLAAGHRVLLGIATPDRIPPVVVGVSGGGDPEGAK